MRVHVPETPVTKALVAALCTYEVAAIASQYVRDAAHPLPTITALNRRWPALGVALVGALAVHFWAPTPPTR